MERNQKIINRIATAAHLQDEPIPGLPLVEIVDNCRVLIEHHLGVTEYGNERIMVKIRRGYICVNGLSMELIQMTKRQLVIRGTIFGVSIIKE